MSLEADSTFQLSDPVANPGNAPAPVASVGSVARAAASERVQEELRQPRRRGRPPGSATKPRETSPAPSPITPEIEAKIEALFKPEAWEPIMSLPADAALMMTGHEHWKLSKEERAGMGATASVAARFLIETNPKTIALILLVGAVAGSYGPRIVKEGMIRKMEREEKEKNK